MDLNSNLNINSKYEFFIHILQDEFVGEGIFRTHQYESKINQEELIKK